MRSPKSEYSKIVRIYMSNKDKEPYPIKFYPGVRPSDIDLGILETINNLKVHSKNKNLKAWNRLTGKEISLQHKINTEFTSLVFGEDASDFQDKSLTTANVTPIQSRRPSEELLAIKANDSKSRQKLKSIIVNKSGPIVEKINKNYDNLIMDHKPEKKKTRSKSSALIAINNSRVQHLTKPNNDNNLNPKLDSSKVIPLSNDRIDTSLLTFNPQKNVSPGEQNNSSNGIVQRVLPQSFGQNLLLGDSQLIHDESKIEENSYRKNDQNSKKALRSYLESPMLMTRRSLTPQTGTIATVAIDGDNSDVYSFKKGLCPFSYMISVMEDVYNAKLPPPVYLPYQTIIDKKPLSKETVLDGLEILPNGDLKLVDPEILKQQKGILKEVFQSLLKSLSEGRGMVGVSLPVRIFEPRSLLERVCDMWTFVPNYIVPATKERNPIEKMKKIVAAAVGGLYVGAKQLKPFNPILGETFQAMFPNENISINIEHTSHHPPIANFLLIHKDFKYWGRYEFTVKLEGVTKNTIIMQQQGPNHVDFSDGSRITFYWPSLQIEGATHGDRTCRVIGHMKFIDEKNNLKTVIKFGENGESKSSQKKAMDAFHGKLYRYKKGRLSVSQKKMEKIEDLNFNDLEENLLNVSGSWLESLKIGEETMWNIDRDLPSTFVPIENPLPSDSRFREDMIWTKRNNKKHAQEWKLKLEERQRFEKKLRLYHKKQQKKH